ncbi:MAG: hypothetical protein SF029_23700 [bacterium]|nr:hypothetical protein [bacterium]
MDKSPENAKAPSKNSRSFWYYIITYIFSEAGAILIAAVIAAFVALRVANISLNDLFLASPDDPSATATYIAALPTYVVETATAQAEQSIQTLEAANDFAAATQRAVETANADGTATAQSNGTREAQQVENTATRRIELTSSAEAEANLTATQDLINRRSTSVAAVSEGRVANSTATANAQATRMVNAANLTTTAIARRENMTATALAQIPADPYSVPVFSSAPRPTFHVGQINGIIRPFPSPTAQTQAVVRGIRLDILGRTRDSDYFLVRHGVTMGWIYIIWGRVEGEISAIPVIDPHESYLSVTGYRATVRTSAESADNVIAYLEQIVVPIIGKTSDQNYYLIVYQNYVGWVQRNSGTVIGNLATVPQLEADRPIFYVGQLGGTLRRLPEYDQETLISVEYAAMSIVGRTRTGYYLVHYGTRAGWIASSWGRVTGDVNSLPIYSENHPLLFVGPNGGYLRSSPELNADILLEVDDVFLRILGRTVDNRYVRVEFLGVRGWIAVSWGTLLADLETIPVLD